PAAASPRSAQIKGTGPSVHVCLAHGSPPGRSLTSTVPSRPSFTRLTEIGGGYDADTGYFLRRFEKIEHRPPHPVPAPLSRFVKAPPKKGRWVTDARGNDTETLVGDTELIARVRDGDTGAYAVLYERHAAAGRGLARQLLRGDAEVDDAVAEAFTRVLSVLQRGGGPTDAFRRSMLTAVRDAA